MVQAVFLRITVGEWFPSLSAGWRIDRENFFAVDPSIISLFKLRANHGELGNEKIGDYQYMDVMARNNYTYSFGNKKSYRLIPIELRKYGYPVGEEENVRFWSRRGHV